MFLANFLKVGLLTLVCASVILAAQCKILSVFSFFETFLVWVDNSSWDKYPILIPHVVPLFPCLISSRYSLRTFCLKLGFVGIIAQVVQVNATQGSCTLIKRRQFACLNVSIILTHLPPTKNVDYV